MQNSMVPDNNGKYQMGKLAVKAAMSSFQNCCRVSGHINWVFDGLSHRWFADI